MIELAYSAPIDGQLIPMTGIHPFYFGMRFAEFLKLLEEWRVVESKIDEHGNVIVTLSKNGLEIELQFDEPDEQPELGPLDFRHLSSIGCNTANLGGASFLCDLTARELQEKTGIEMIYSEEHSFLDPSLDICEKAFTEPESDSDFSFMIWESDGQISNIHLMKLVPGTYVEE